MAFLLSRGGANVIAEVQRWQYFLLRMDIGQVGAIDGDFGLNTETATKFFQVKCGISTTGRVDDQTLGEATKHGYTIVDDDHYEQIADEGFPPRPPDLQSPTDEARHQNFGCFRFSQLPRAQRPDAEAIVTKGSCDGHQVDWTAANIIRLPVPQLRFARGSSGTIRCHEAAAPVFRAMFEAWERDDLLHLVRTYEGAFNARYKRDQAPLGSAGHGELRSSDVGALSNHAFGSALDINAGDNPFRQMPAICGHRGCVRELVAAANRVGVFWGGHFGSPKDGMHFEVSRLDRV